jgi:hypothetical protein
MVSGYFLFRNRVKSLPVRPATKQLTSLKLTRDQIRVYQNGEISNASLISGVLTPGAAGCLSAHADRCSTGLGLYLLGTLPGNHNGEYRAIKEKAEAPVPTHPTFYYI